MDIVRSETAPYHVAESYIHHDLADIVKMQESLQFIGLSVGHIPRQDHQHQTQIYCHDDRYHRRTVDGRQALQVGINTHRAICEVNQILEV